MECTPFCISDAPTEILESILNFLHDDRTSLFSASLVCRTWVHTPRHHLFHRTLIMEIFGRGRLKKDNAHSFLALAESKDCTILPAIQHIILVITDPKLIDDVIHVLARSPLLVRMVYMHRSRADSISWNAHALPMIREFAFDFPWSTLDDHAWSLIRSFSGLHTLSVYSSSLSTVVMPSDVLGSPFSNLRTLRLRLRASEELFEWLIQKDLDGSHFMLETLDLRIHRPSHNHNGWGSVSALNSFLAKSADTLKHLSVGIDYTPDSEDNSANEETDIDLRPLVNLRSIFLRTHDLDSICNSLASLNSSTMEVITIHAPPWYFDRYSKTKRCDCVHSQLLTKLARIIEEKQLSATKLFDLHMPEEFKSDGRMPEQLVNWVQTGTLKLSTVDDEDVQCDSLDAIRSLMHLKSN